MDFTTMITNLGFPIACVVVLAYYAGNLSKQTRADGIERENKLIEANKEFAVALNKASESMAESARLQTALYDTMHGIECKIDVLDSKVEIIKNSVLK